MFEAIKKFFTNKSAIEISTDCQQKTPFVSNNNDHLTEIKIPKIKHLKKTFASKTEAMYNK